MISPSQVTGQKKEECNYDPKASSFFKYSFHDDTDIPIIDGLRAWSAKYFEKYKIYDSIVRIPTSEQTHKDFDVHAKVIKVEHMDDLYCQMKLKSICGSNFTIRLNH
jgi:hypothetical protein